MKQILRIWCLVLLTMLMPVVAQAADEEEVVPENYVNYIELKPFVTNFGTPSNLRFMKADVTIQVASPAAHHAVNAHMAQIRNDLVFLFSAQTEASLKSVEAQGELAQKALKLVQQILVREEGEAFVSDLFFTSLVVQ